jgi:beta-glucanase (GH16 family)
MICSQVKKILLIAGIALSMKLPPPTDTAEIPVRGYSLFWSEEFNGNALNRQKWNYRGIGKRNDAFNSEKAVRLNGKGQLVIESRMSGDSILAGIIDTQGKLETRYGYFECRASLHKNPGIWVGFWLQSHQNTDHSSPEKNGAEIDIFEYAPHNRVNDVAHALHYGGYGPTHRIFGPFYSPLLASPDNFHVFGLEWTPGSYTIFVDGKKMYTTDTLISRVQQFLVLSLEAIRPPLDIKKLPDRFVVDYVRVYKKNKQ